MLWQNDYRNLLSTKTMDTSPYMSLYLQESRENSAKIIQNLLLVEKNATPEILTELMRLSHSCKGAAATMGYEKTAELCHNLESIFDAVRLSKFTLTPGAIDLCLRTMDIFEKALEHIEKMMKEPESYTITNALKELATGVMPHSTTEPPIASEELTTIQTFPHVRVASSKLDTLLELSGELVVLQQQMTGVPLDPLSTLVMRPLVDRFEKIAEEMRYHVMQSRLIPVEQVFVKFPRLVREIAKDQKKSINFSMKGTDIELDKTLIDHLTTPLIHMLRNAVDHGIESPEERRKLGKPEEGTITLSVERNGAFIAVSVEDDGVQLRADELKIRARTIGMSESEIAAITDETILDLLVSGRFSMSENVSMISGRGVGLSSVYQTMRHLGGTLKLEQGAGTKKFILTFPLQLSVVQMILVRVNNQIFGLPFIHIHQILTVQSEMIHSSLHEPCITLGGQQIPLVYLHKTYSKTPSDTLENKNECHVLIADDGKQKVGLCVDTILHNEEVMVSAIPSALRDVQWLSGCALLGDGSIALIVDIPRLLAEYAVTLSHS